MISVQYIHVNNSLKKRISTEPEDYICTTCGAMSYEPTDSCSSCDSKSSPKRRRIKVMECVESYLESLSIGGAGDFAARETDENVHA